MSIATDQKVKELLVRVTELEHRIEALEAAMLEFSRTSLAEETKSMEQKMIDKRSLEYRKSIGRS